MTIRDPIFLLGSERSGTNLLRRILDGHPNIAGPPAPHLVKWLLPRVPYYGDLDDDDAFRQLVDDAFEVIATMFDVWELDLDAATLVGRIPPEERTLLRVVAELYDSYAAQRGKPRWFSKENALVQYAFELALHFPAAKFVYLVRDPRDVYCSFLKTSRGPKHPLVFAEQWTREQDACLRLATHSQLADAIIVLKYEDLLQDPEAKTRELCQHIGETFSESMLSPERGSGFATQSTFFENLKKGILQENFGKYRSALSNRQIRTIEETAFNPMSFHGYAPELTERPAPSSFLRRATAFAVHALRSSIAQRTRPASEEERLQARQRRKLRRQLNARANRLADKSSED